MSSTSVKNLLDSIEQYTYNPAGIQRTVLQVLKDVTNGEIDIVDATNPFVFALESSACLVSGALTKTATLTRKQYPYSALNQEDIYPHMSDKDFVGRFATPSQTKFGILIMKEELEKRLVAVPDLGIKKLVIPRNTIFSIAEVDFSLQYPIEIRMMAHGGYQIVYDGDIVSPLQALATNHIQFEIRTNKDGEWLYFEVDVQQFNIVSRTSSLNAATGFSVDIDIDDSFYYCRVYHQNADGTWAEIKTTHTSEIYDIKEPTAVVTVNDKIVTVEIPQIYTTTSMMDRGIRVDVYQTKGPLNMILSNYSIDAFSAKWLAIDTNEQTEFVAPLSTFKSIIPFSTSVVSGGSAAISFDTLRNRVMTNSVGINQIPITPDQRNTLFAIKGYEVVKYVDLVTDRKFLATRDLPAPTNKVTTSPASATIAVVEMSMEDTVLLSGSIDNGLRVTITPDAVYGLRNGVVKHITQQEVNGIKVLPADQQASMITTGNYFYSPFHYVLDAASNEFALRPYYMDSPETIAKLFVNENDTTLLEVSIGSFNIVKEVDGYSIYILTSSGDTYKAIPDDELQIQLGYYPPGEKDRAYLNGTLFSVSGDERVFKFKITSSFDIDRSNYLYVNSFLMYTEDAKKLPIDLSAEFDVFFTTTTGVGSQYVRSSIEDAMGELFLPTGVKAIMHEKIKVRFGYELSTLWSRARTIVTPEYYRRYDIDVPAVYQTDIYKTDSATGSIFTIDAAGEITYEILHAKGSPILDADGNQVYSHRVGDYYLDNFQKPVPQAPRKISRLCDIFLIDGVYAFVTGQAVIDYRVEMVKSLVSWLSNDLTGIEEILLEKTNVYYYPKTTIGDIDVLVNGGIATKLSAQQSLVVTLYVPDRVYANDKLKETITTNTIATLLAELSKSQIAVSKMIESLRVSYGSDVIDVKVTGFGGDSNFDVATIVNNTSKFSIRKRLLSLADNTLTVADDVEVKFVRHRLT